MQALLSSASSSLTPFFHRSQVGPEVQAKLGALRNGRQWLAKMKAHKLLAEADMTTAIDEEQAALRAQHAAIAAAARTSLTGDPGSPGRADHSPPTSPGKQGGARGRGGARASVAAGSGFHATRVAGANGTAQDNGLGMLTVKAAVLDRTKTMVHRAKGRDARSRWVRMRAPHGLGPGCAGHGAGCCTGCWGGGS